MFRQFPKAALLILVGVAFGFGVGLLVPRLFSRHIDTGWRTLVVSDRHFGLGYATEVVFSDLPVGEVTDLKGRAKFIDDVSSSSEQYKLGYIIDVTMLDPERSKIPERYLQQTVELINGQNVVSGPMEHAYYAIEFTFALKDKDDFQLLQLVSKEETLISGQTNRFQSVVETKVPYKVAIRPRAIGVSPAIVKCHTCKK
jgi:hypothetical protein